MNAEQDRIERLAQQMSVEPSKALDERIQVRADDMFDRFKQTPHPTWMRQIGSIIINSKAGKTGVAAVILIAILTTIHFWGSPMEGMAWADVVHPVLTAHTVVFNARSLEGENLPIARVTSMGTQRVRSEILSADVQVIAIYDYDTSQMLTLNPKQKIAAIVDIKGLPEKPENFVEIMRNMINELQHDPDVSIESLEAQP